MIQTCPNIKTVKEATGTDWQEIGLKTLAILLVPVIWTFGLFFAFMAAYVVIGAFYLGRMLGMFVHLLAVPLMNLLQLSQETQDRVAEGILCVTCPLGVAFMFSTVWR
jgi:membrane protein YdbS with pleckstrin-like domain